MAGSWNHMTTGSGKLRNNETFNGMIENGGDAYEAAEECFGMVWWLAERLLAATSRGGPPERARVLGFVQAAQENYRAGLKLGGVQRNR